MNSCFLSGHRLSRLPLELEATDWKGGQRPYRDARTHPARSGHSPRLLARGKLSGSSSRASSEIGDASCSWSGRRLCWVCTAGDGASFGAGAPAALGRPPLNVEVQVLIATMGRQNLRTE